MALLFDSTKKGLNVTIEDAGLAVQSTHVGDGAGRYTFLTDAVAGKQYYEFLINELGPAVSLGGGDGSDLLATLAAGFEWESDGSWVINGAGQGGGAGGIVATYTTGDVVMFAVDVTGGKVYLGKNGTWIGSHNPAAGTGGHSVTFSGTRYMGAAIVSNSSGTLRKVTGKFTAASQSYAAPTGFSPADPGGGGGVTLDGAAVLAGSGTLAFASMIVRSAAAGLSASGTMSAAATVTRGAAAAMAGSGSLASVARLSLPGTTTLAGSGNLTAAASRSVPGSASLSGTGTATATARLTLLGSTALDGVGTLTSVATVTSANNGSASLSGSGSFTAVATLTRGAAATLRGSGAITASASAARPGSASLMGLGGLSALTRLEAGAVAVLSATGTLTATVAAEHKLPPSSARTAQSPSVSRLAVSAEIQRVVTSANRQRVA